ncbi:hypothetical protein BU17DRAFT_66289 [Hysterangium stoloniferum]|nr:hypothetical protein BU17DRAFT_66289 [Hysterangium stoloniferum]
MSGHYNNNYSSTSRSTRQDRDGERRQELPPLREVLPEQFGDPYNFDRMSRGLQTDLTLPPIREHSSRGRQNDYGYNRPIARPEPYSQEPSRGSAANVSRSTAGSRDPVYHFLAPSDGRDQLIAVFESYSKPPGILHKHTKTYDNDSSKKFANYHQHMLTHTGERPFECSYCPKGFSSKSNLNRHMLSHGGRKGNKDDGRDRHGEPSSKNYYSIAGSESYSKPPGILREHTLPKKNDDDSKKKFECDVCGRRIARQSAYDQHMVTHTGARPFECSYCGKAFNYKYNRNRHVLTHRGGKGNKDGGRDRHGEPSSSKN